VKAIPTGVWDGGEQRDTLPSGKIMMVTGACLARHTLVLFRVVEPCVLER
jgi:hypothetical protein